MASELDEAVSYIKSGSRMFKNIIRIADALEKVGDINDVEAKFAAAQVKKQEIEDSILAAKASQQAAENKAAEAKRLADEASATIEKNALADAKPRIDALNEKVENLLSRVSEAQSSLGLLNKEIEDKSKELDALKHHIAKVKKEALRALS